MKLPPQSQVAEAHEARLRVLRSMTPEQRLVQALELSDFVRTLFRQGLRLRFPTLTDDEINSLFLERLDLCHNERIVEKLELGAEWSALLDEADPLEF